VRGGVEWVDEGERARRWYERRTVGERREGKKRKGWNTGGIL